MAVIDVRATFLAMIRGAVGSNQYRHLFMREGNVVTDILEDGDLSCAFFASSVLHSAKLVAAPHATVVGLEKDLLASGWVVVDTPEEGDVIVWEPASQSGAQMHPHVGFAIGGDRAISNSYKEHTPVEHHITFGVRDDGAPARSITAIYRHALIAGDPVVG